MSPTDTPPLCLPPLPLTRPPKVKLPPGTVDTHFHVFEPGAQLSTPRSYTPCDAGLSEWLSLADAAGISRGIFVQPSVYGFDNSVLLRALNAHPDRLRGVVVIPPDLPQAELARMNRSGVRGIRINTRNLGGLSFDTASILAGRVAPLGWSLQFQVNPAQLKDIAALVPSLGLPVVIDHLGFIQLAQPEAAGYLRDLQTVLDAGDCYAKISSPYRLDKEPGHAAFGRAVETLVRSHPERLIWGTDWPHPELWDAVPDDADLIEKSQDWLGSDVVRKQVLVSTPQALFFKDQSPAT